MWLKTRPKPPPTPELVAERAKSLDVTLYGSAAQQRKALIRKFVKELRVMSRDRSSPRIEFRRWFAHQDLK